MCAASCAAGVVECAARERRARRGRGSSGWTSRTTHPTPAPPPLLAPRSPPLAPHSTTPDTDTSTENARSFRPRAQQAAAMAFSNKCVVVVSVANRCRSRPLRHRAPAFLRHARAARPAREAARRLILVGDGCARPPRDVVVARVGDGGARTPSASSSFHLDNQSCPAARAPHCGTGSRSTPSAELTRPSPRSARSRATPPTTTTTTTTKPQDVAARRPRARGRRARAVGRARRRRQGRRAVDGRGVHGAGQGVRGQGAEDGGGHLGAGAGDGESSGAGTRPLVLLCALCGARRVFAGASRQPPLLVAARLTPHDDPTPPPP